jgi:hypothetical protein
MSSVWAPLIEPVTLIGPMADGAMPRNEIWFTRVANRLPAMGNTLTCGASAHADPASSIAPAVTASAIRITRVLASTPELPGGHRATTGSMPARFAR